MQQYLYTLLFTFTLLLLPTESILGQWTEIPLPNEHPEVFALAVHANNELVIGTGGLPNSSTNAMGILWSNDHGDNITQRSTGLLDTRFDRLFRSIISLDGWLVAGSADGVYFSNDSGKNWRKDQTDFPLFGKHPRKAQTV